MTADYQSGDLHMRFAIRAGLAPEWATKRSHGAVRDDIKPVSLGVHLWDVEIWRRGRHRKVPDVGRRHAWRPPSRLSGLHSGSRTRSPRRMFDERIVSPLGWPMAVHADTNKRTLLNYMQQAGGADMMRLAAIAGYEAGIKIFAPVHDAFWIMAPLAELDDAIATMSALMVRAGRVVTGGLDIPVEVTAVVRWPQCLGDVRKPDAKGQAMWNEIKELMRGRSLRAVS